MIGRSVGEDSADAETARPSRFSAGESFFNSNTAERWNLTVIALALVSAVLSIGAAALNFRDLIQWRVLIELMSTLALLSALMVSYWAIYLAVAVSRLLNPSLGPLPDDALAPGTLLALFRATRSDSLPSYKLLPLLWRSSMATTIRRLRIVSVILVYVIVQVTIANPTFARGHFAPVAYLVNGAVLVILCFAVPMVLIDNARRHVNRADVAAFNEDVRQPWARRLPSLVVGVVLLVASGVILVERISSIIDHPTALSGHATTGVQLPASTQTIYTGCNGDLRCSSLTPAEIKVIDTAKHRSIPVVADVGIDHESFHEHPWLSVASFRAPQRARYLISLGGDPAGTYALSLSQIDFVHQIAPLVVTTVLRLIGVGLALTAIVEISKRGTRRRRRRSASHSN